MRKWYMTTIRTNKQANDMLMLARTLAPKVGAFDSETNGLHIIHATPFLFQFGFLHPTEPVGYTFAVDIEKQPQLAKQVITAWHAEAEKLDLYMAHNIKFDLHMLTNIGLPYTKENLSDSMFYIRYAHDALTPENGGPPMGLKDYSARYISRDAKSHDKLIQQERSAIAKNLNMKLRQRLLACGAPPAEYKAASYTIGVLKAIFADPIADWRALPTEQARNAYDDWLHLDVPAEIRDQVTGLIETDMIPYTWCDRETVIRYAHYDIVWVLEIYEKLKDVVRVRGNQCGVDIENSLIIPLYYMERVGFSVDVPYLRECKTGMKDYIVNRRERLAELVGEPIKITQRAKIIKVLQDMGVDTESTADDVLARVKADLQREDAEAHTDSIEIISLIQELRTLEKWYSVYICRFIHDLHNTDRLYTTINQVGTVSGRVTSDFQQFPKKGIKTVEGELLFHPRHMIRVSGGDYDSIVYLDYSQIELRFQALYTILVGHPDLNLCRAYMPYKCVDKNGVAFDYNNPDHIRQWNAEWYYEEDPNVRWTPTDVHGATTKAAFDIDESHPDFHALRYVGKRVNFAKNYGAQYGKICEMFPEYDAEHCHKIDGAYYKAFPGVKEYHNYCYKRAECYGSTTNLFGVKYYGVSGHKLINLLVQGSAAYYLKTKIRELYDYSLQYGLKTRWQMQIHDELSWEHHKDDDPAILFEFKKIMEAWDESMVPVVADMEITKTTWDAKEEVTTLDEVQIYLST